MEPFTVPCADELFCKEYDFSPFQQSMADQTIRWISEVLDDIRVNGEQFEDMYYMRMLTIYVIRFYVSKFTKHDSRICTIYTVLTDEQTHESEVIHKVTDDAGAVIEILYNHIIKNLTQCGIYTECWDHVDPLLLLTSGTRRGIIIPTALDDGSFEYQRVADASFESARQKLVNDTFNPKDTVNHEFQTIGSEARTSDNAECGICCGEATFVCADCKYSMCNECIERFKHSTGQCPCCQTSPIKLLELIA